MVSFQPVAYNVNYMSGCFVRLFGPKRSPKGVPGASWGPRAAPGGPMDPQRVPEGEKVACTRLRAPPLGLPWRLLERGKIQKGASWAPLEGPSTSPGVICIISEIVVFP